MGFGRITKIYRRLSYGCPSRYGVDWRVAGKQHNLRARWLLGDLRCEYERLQYSKDYQPLWNGFLVDRRVLCAWRDHAC